MGDSQDYSSDKSPLTPEELYQEILEALGLDSEVQNDPILQKILQELKNAGSYGKGYETFLEAYK